LTQKLWPVLREYQMSRIENTSDSRLRTIKAILVATLG